MKLHITVTKFEAAEYVRQAITKVTPNLGTDVQVEITDGGMLPTVPESVVKELIIDALNGRNKIGFIKNYRQITGCGLKEAKDASESLIPAFAPRGFL